MDIHLRFRSSYNAFVGFLGLVVRGELRVPFRKGTLGSVTCLYKKSDDLEFTIEKETQPNSTIALMVLEYAAVLVILPLALSL